jgi:aminomethyltransferase
VARLDEDCFRMTAAEPAFAWLARHARGFDVRIEDTSQSLAALALQGPASRQILCRIAEPSRLVRAPLVVHEDVGRLRYFGVTRALIRGAEVWISRTGYTGDLGYEIWVPNEHALGVWDALVDAGRDFRMLPAGLDALDVTRVEAGFILNGVDYTSANHCLLESRKRTPFEIGLGWTVKLDRGPFIGQAALATELARGPRLGLAGLVLDWEEYEALFAALGLPPQVPSGAWRAPVPVYDLGGRQVGQATSGAWSPLLKKNLALATVRAEYGDPGTRLRMEVTVEYRRRSVGATVTETPFFDPERKRAVFGAARTGDGEKPVAAGVHHAEDAGGKVRAGKKTRPEDERGAGKASTVSPRAKKPRAGSGSENAGRAP